MRIHQYLSKSGLFSTKEKAMLALKSGQIKIGNKVIYSEHHVFNEKKERVYYKDNHVLLKKEILIALNKPEGYVCAKLSDNEKKEGKKSVYELLPKELQHLSCVGRLDENSKGLLFMTNDGDLIQQIISKENKVPKRYIVRTQEDISDEDCAKLSSGVTIVLEENGIRSNYLTKPCEVLKLNNNLFEIVLYEGKKRQIRRMIESINNSVISLTRISIGNFSLEEHKIGEETYVNLNKNDLFNKS